MVSQGNLQNAFSIQKFQLNRQTIIVDQVSKIVDSIYKGFSFEVKEFVNNEIMDVVAFRFIKTINKFLEVLANDPNDDREKWMDVIRQLDQELTGEHLLDNLDYTNGNIDLQNYELTVNELMADIIFLIEIDKENKTEGIAYVLKFFTRIETQMQQIVKHEEVNNIEETIVSENVPGNRQNPVGVYEDFEQRKINVILERFLEIVAKFRKSLNEDEIVETIYFLEDTKATWAKQMDEIKQREYELTTVYLLGNDIVKEFGDIEKVYNLKLKELNRKINELKETDKANKTEAIVNIQNRTEMQQVRQKAEPEKADCLEGTKMSKEGDKNQEKEVNPGMPKDMASILQDRFKYKIAALRNILRFPSLDPTSRIYYVESRKACLEKKMVKLEQLEHELATVYLLNNDINKEFNSIEMQYDSQLSSINSLLGHMKR